MKDYIKTQLKENLIYESYGTANELGELAIDIINHFAERNIPVVYRIDKTGPTNAALTYETVNLKDIVWPANYPTLGKFIEEDNVLIRFLGRFYSDGEFTVEGGQPVITICYGKEIYMETLKKQLKFVRRDPEDKSIDPDDAYTIMNTALIAASRRDLLHELKHAYDSFISGGKFMTDKKSLKHYAKAGASELTTSEMSPEDEKTYYALPHEYWARFVTTVNEIPKELPWKSFWFKFEDEFVGWNVLGPNAKNRLRKAAYKYYTLPKK